LSDPKQDIVMARGPYQKKETSILKIVQKDPRMIDGFFNSMYY